MSFTIEIVGPSGVGKSTLRQELGDAVTASLNFQPNGISPSGDQYKHLDTPHFELLKKKSYDLSSLKINSVRKTILLNYYTSIILQDLSVKFVETKAMFLLEEGLFHNFAKELAMLSDIEFLNLGGNRSFIYLRPEDPKTVADRILLRAKDVEMTVHHQGFTYEELVQLTDDSITVLDKMVTRLIILGFSVLHLSAEAEKSKNKISAEKFIASQKQY